MAWLITTEPTYYVVSVKCEPEAQYRVNDIYPNWGDKEYRSRVVVITIEQTDALTDAASTTVVNALGSISVDGSGNTTTISVERRRGNAAGAYSVIKTTKYEPAWPATWTTYEEA